MRLCTHAHLYTHRVLTPVASFARAVSDNSPKSTGPTMHGGIEVPSLQSENTFVLRQTTANGYQICEVQKTIGDSQIEKAVGFLGEAEKLLVVDDDPALDERDGTRGVTLGTRSKFDGIQAEKPESQQVLAASAPVRHDLAHVTATSRKSLLMDQVLRRWENVCLPAHALAGSCCTACYAHTSCSCLETMICLMPFHGHSGTHETNGHWCAHCTPFPCFFAIITSLL